jgi:hypothetical protein
MESASDELLAGHNMVEGRASVSQMEWPDSSFYQEAHFSDNWPSPAVMLFVFFFLSCW